MLCSCTPAAPATWDGPCLSEPRAQLTFEQLQQNRFIPLVDMSYLAKPNWAGEAAHSFSASLSFADTRMMFPIERHKQYKARRLPVLPLIILDIKG